MTKMEQSIFYLIEIIGRLTREKIQIKIGNVIKEYLPAEEVILSSTFFRKGVCSQCGGCCRKIDTDLFYTARPLQELKEYFSLKVPVIVVKNLDRFIHYVYVFKKQKHCILLEDNKCKIHQNKPLQCLIHPIHIDVLYENIYIRKRQYGRNYRFGCKIKFENFDYQYFIQHDIVFLKKLNQAANDLDISTFIPDIVFYLEKNMKNYQQGKIPKDNVLIKSKR